MSQDPRRILLAVTAHKSLTLMSGFAEYLADNGWEVHVVSAPGVELRRFDMVQGITTHPLPMHREPSVLADLAALAAWVRLLRKVRPDIMSFGTPKAALLASCAGWLTRVPHRVYLLRGLRLETTSGGTRVLLRLLERLTVLSSHHVISVSRSLRDRVIELGIAPPHKVSVLGAGSSNGVFTESYARSRFSALEIAELRLSLNLEPGVPVVGFVGRLTHDKGLSALAAARRILVEDCVEHQLLVVGRADDATGESMLKLLRSAGRKPAETGEVPDSAIYYQLMDVLCLPTLREGFPNVVLEASASGVPTVTTTATGAIDSVVDGVTGLLCAPNSGTDLAEKLSMLIGDEDLRQEMGRSARTFAEENYQRIDVWTRAERYFHGRVGGV